LKGLIFEGLLPSLKGGVSGGRMKIIEVYLPIYSLSYNPLPKDNLAIFKFFQEYMITNRGLKVTASEYLHDAYKIGQYRYCKEV